jgi:hypothetical protein
MAMPQPANTPEPPPPYLFIRIGGVVLLVMLLISAWAQWYGRQVSLPRYCDDPQGTLQHLEKVLYEPRPAGDSTRRPYIIAAKLIFLLPRKSTETVPAYLTRVEAYIQDTCR